MKRSLRTRAIFVFRGLVLFSRAASTPRRTVANDQKLEAKALSPFNFQFFCVVMHPKPSTSKRAQTLFHCSAISALYFHLCSPFLGNRFAQRLGLFRILSSGPRPPFRYPLFFSSPSTSHLLYAFLLSPSRAFSPSSPLRRHRRLLFLRETFFVSRCTCSTRVCAARIKTQAERAEVKKEQREESNSQPEDMCDFIRHPRLNGYSVSRADPRACGCRPLRVKRRAGVAPPC